MKTKLLCLFIMLACLAGIHQAAAQGTAFTYQGRLNTNGSPATGSFDFRFKLFPDSAGNLPQVGATFLANGVPVAGGLFTTTVDFGAGIFTGSNYFLLIGISTNGGVTYTALSPLQPVTPTPYAIMANSASNVSGTILGAQLTGTIANGVLPASPVFSGTVTASNFLSGPNGAFIAGQNNAVQTNDNRGFSNTGPVTVTALQSSFTNPTNTFISTFAFSGTNGQNIISGPTGCFGPQPGAPYGMTVGWSMSFASKQYLFLGQVSGNTNAMYLQNSLAQTYVNQTGWSMSPNAITFRDDTPGGGLLTGAIDGGGNGWFPAMSNNGLMLMGDYPGGSNVSNSFRIALIQEFGSECLTFNSENFDRGPGGWAQFYISARAEAEALGVDGNNGVSVRDHLTNDLGGSVHVGGGLTVDNGLSSFGSSTNSGSNGVAGNLLVAGNATFAGNGGSVSTYVATATDTHGNWLWQASSGGGGGSASNVTAIDPLVATPGGGNVAISFSGASTNQFARTNGTGPITAGYFSGDGGGLTDLNINGATINNISNATMQFITLISNVPNLVVNQPIINGTVSGKAGSRYWTNTSGWTYTVNGVSRSIPRFSYLQTTLDQPAILSYPSSTVAFMDQPASSNFTSAVATVNPPYFVVNDTIPRQVGAWGDAGSFFLLTADEANEPVGIYLGGLTNWFRIDHYNDTSGNGLCFRTTSGGPVDVVAEIYDHAPEHAFDVLADGEVGIVGGVTNRSGVFLINSGLTLTHGNPGLGSAWVLSGTYNPGGLGTSVAATLLVTNTTGGTIGGWLGGAMEVTTGSAGSLSIVTTSTNATSTVKTTTFTVASTASAGETPVGPVWIDIANNQSATFVITQTGSATYIPHLVFDRKQ